MKARIPSHREFIINFPDSVDQAKANEGWAKLQHQHIGASHRVSRLHSPLRKSGLCHILSSRKEAAAA